jgi:RimJ/RimL family protein N-acetyltransferase
MAGRGRRRSRTVKIRRARPEDLPQLVEMGGRFLNNPDYKGVIAFVPEKVDNLMRRLGAAEDALLLVADNNGTLTGMIAFAVYDHPISGEKIGGEVFWWAEDKSSAGLKLLRAAEAWAISKDATILQMIAPNERVGRLYKHFGYREVEVMWQRRL